MPAETPVTRIRLPRRLMPDRTSSVVEVAPNSLVEVTAELFAMIFTPCWFSPAGHDAVKMIRINGGYLYEEIIGESLRLHYFYVGAKGVHVAGSRAASSRRIFFRDFEIVRPIEVSDERRMCWLPSQLFLRLRTRSRSIDSKEVRDPAKMPGSFLWRLGNQRQVQASADYGSDIANRYAFVGDSVIPGSCGTFFKCEPVQMRSIEPVHSGPTIKTVTYIRRDAFFACNVDQSRNKTMVAVSMHRWRKAHHHDMNASRQQCKRVFRLAREIGIGFILFRYQRTTTLEKQRSGSHEQWPVRTSELGSERLNGAPVRFGGRSVVIEVMDEGRVNHAVRSGRSAAKAFEVLERAAMHLSPSGDKRFSSCIRASEAEYLMTRVNQLTDDSRTDETCSACKENTHFYLL